MARILVVDDSDSIRQTLKLTLLFRQFEVMEASNGVEALEQLRNQSCDLVFTDLAMPGMGGVELIGRLRADPATQALPIIILSAEEQAEKKRALEAGASDSVDKPFSPQQIFDAVERYLPA